MRRFILIACLLMLDGVTPFAGAQISPPASGGGSGGPPAPPPSTATTGGTLVDLQIQYIGTLRLELYDRDKPASVRNFLGYVARGAYANSFLHRSLSNFVVQGGSMQVISFNSGSQAVVPVAEAAPVTNELAVGRFFSNTRGTIALAHYDGETNNATCHWLINLTNNAWLDAADTNHAYTVFGRVISGLELLDKLNPAASNSAVKMLNLGGWLTDLPVRPTATAAGIIYSDLLMTTYRIAALDMNVWVQQTNSTRRVTWQSVSNAVHTIEYAPTVKGPWQTLSSTNGNGGVQTLTDTNKSVLRFYRGTYR